MLETVLNIPDVAIFVGEAIDHQPQLLSHSLYTAAYSESIGKSLGISAEEMHTLVIGAVLHDHGKLKIPQTILEKPARLDDVEWDFMKVHPLLGLVDAPLWLSPDMTDIIRHHHEKLDGSGYPDGVTDIRPLTRIVSVADMFEAITAERCYKRQMTKAEALKILYDDVASTKVDLEVVEALEKSLTNPISPISLYLPQFLSDIRYN